MAASLNRQYIAIIRDTIKNIPKSDSNPLDMYIKSLGPIDSKIDMQTLSMHEFTKILSSMGTYNQHNRQLHISQNAQRGWICN